MQAKSDWKMEKDRQPKAAEEPKEEHKPHLSVKVKGAEGFAGSAWVNPSKFNGGKYVSVLINVDVPAGSVLYLSPRKDFPDCLG